MLKKRAKILSKEQVIALLSYVSRLRHPTRNKVLILLSVRAGLRAGEIAALSWPMVLDATGQVAGHMELRDHACKMLSGRIIPLNRHLKAALTEWRAISDGQGPVIKSERGGHMRPGSIVKFFERAYGGLGFVGASSHSGRRTFITRAARLVHQAGGSLRDVQILAGHREIGTTAIYIEGDTDAQRRLVALV
jgi:integrase/recombinase XerD